MWICEYFSWNTADIYARSEVFGSKTYYKESNRVRAHACKHSELGGRDKSTTDVTARRSHRPEQKRRGEGGGV